MIGSVEVSLIVEEDFPVAGFGETGRENLSGRVKEKDPDLPPETLMGRGLKDWTLAFSRVKHPNPPFFIGQCQKRPSPVPATGQHSIAHTLYVEDPRFLIKVEEHSPVTRTDRNQTRSSGMRDNAFGVGVCPLPHVQTQ
jgi:hypothetical protein